MILCENDAMLPTDSAGSPLRKTAEDFFARVEIPNSGYSLSACRGYYLTNSDDHNPYPWWEPTHSAYWECFNIFAHLGPRGRDVSVSWCPKIFFPDWAVTRIRGTVNRYSNGHGRGYQWWNHVEVTP